MIADAAENFQISVLLVKVKFLCWPTKASSVVLNEIDNLPSLILLA